LELSTFILWKNLQNTQNRAIHTFLFWMQHIHVYCCHLLSRLSWLDQLLFLAGLVSFIIGLFLLKFIC
jgi:hypothetical protein